MFHIKNYIKLNFLKFIVVIIFFFALSLTTAQTKTNLQIFYNLVDSSVIKINQDISTPGLRINFSSGNYFTVFQNQVISDFIKLGKTVFPDHLNDSSAVTLINYSIDNAKVKYGEMERDGFLGNFIMQRKINLRGSYSLNNRIINSKNFSLIFIDTVAVDEINTIENSSFPFTQSELPSEPFFSSLFEPAVAISSAVLAVILFFTIRSK